MRVYLLHHAEAVGPEVDSGRPLSSRGQRQAEWLAGEAAGRGVAPAAIWHSGKLRARQTAECVLRRVPFAEFRMVRGLRPEDPPGWMRDELAAEERDVLLAGHMPNLAAIAHLLLPDLAGFPLHSLIGLERQKDGGYRLLWILTPEPGN
jgi:phosphohistidine phosphatase